MDNRSKSGATPTTGAIAAGFDLTRDYPFFAFVLGCGWNLCKVNFVTLTRVVATIPAGNAAVGKLFGRLNATCTTQNQRFPPSRPPHSPIPSPGSTST